MAETNKVKADTASQYVSMGALDGVDVRASLVADPQSGFNGIDPLKEIDVMDDNAEEDFS